MATGRHIFVLFCILPGLLSKPHHDETKRLIKTGLEEKAQWLSSEEIWQLIVDEVKFVDITGNPELDNYVPKRIASSEIPTELKYQSEVRYLIRLITSTQYMNTIERFSIGFFNRYYNGRWGQDSQRWWKLNMVSELLTDYPGEYSVIDVDHGFMQKSIIARLEGVDPLLKDQVVILGAHIDSISRDGPETLAPGADDNAAGSVAILAALRTLVTSGGVPRRTLEFHWYAGEEGGLLGSQGIAQLYKEQGKNVVAMLNQDVIGYHVEGIDDIGLHTDNGSPEMVEFVKLLTDEYLSYGWRNMSCGYGCSDHASWTMNGFPAVMTTAVVSNPAHHRSNDTVDAVDSAQTREFIKLCIGFMLEMGELDPNCCKA